MRTRPATPQTLDELRLLLDELSASLGEQRRALSQLAGDRVTWLVQQQSRICARIESLLTSSGTRAPLDEPLLALVSSIRGEAEATALLATLAAQNVRSLLEQGESSGYSSSARPTRTTSPICLLTTL
ncbi:MAG: hypothetical protein R3B48_25910 [Kofleriaceae bacterium]